MEHYELLYNLEKPNKFGKDTVGSLSSRGFVAQRFEMQSAPN